MMTCQSVFRLGIVSILLFFLSADSLLAQQGDQIQKNNIRFLWTFGTIQDNPNGGEFKSVSQDMVLNTGDQIKFFIKRNNRCHVYLLYYNSKGELNVLFPHRFQASPVAFSGPETYFIPEGSMWFELDSCIGKETFYLLASADRLNDLETLINQYENADPNARAGLLDSIFGEIRLLKKKNIQLKVSAERPVRIIGSKRGTVALKNFTNEDLALHAVKIAGNDFYCRTYTIDHQ